MSPLTASVPPLLAPPVSKYARIVFCHFFNVLPSLAISGIGHVGKASITLVASRFPCARESWWNMSRTS